MSTPSTPLRILWAAPICLHDSSSGAAIQVKLMFEKLVQRGFSCHVLSALTFDSPNGAQVFSHVAERLKDKTEEWFSIQDNGISYRYFNTKSYTIGEMTRIEESTFYRGFLEALHDYQPDMLFIYGGSPLEMAIVAECKRRGIMVVLGVYNGYYAKYNFPGVDMLFTDSALSARNYYNDSRINIMPTGVFIDPDKVAVRGKIEPKYITLINPSSAKGVSLMMRLALMAREKYPEVRFLVVESRGTWASALAFYRQNPADFWNVDVATHTQDITLVFAKTKILLAPSLWYEGFGRVTAEALLNGIPVIASKSGGLAGTVGTGGVCLDAPAECTKAGYEYFPSEEEMGQWFEALEEMMDKENYLEWQEKAKEASKEHYIEKNTDIVLGYIDGLFKRLARYSPHYFIK